MKNSLFYRIKSGIFIFGLFFWAGIAPALAGTPTVNTIAITSIPTGVGGGETYYQAGDTIEFTVTFSEDIQVTGTPNLQFRIREQLEEAAYSSQLSTTELKFGFNVTAGIASGLNDWDGIEAEKFENFTLANFIESTIDNQSVVEDFSDANFTTIRVDADTPTYTSLLVNPVGSTENGGTEYINAEDSDGIQLALTLAEKDTWGTNSFSITDGTNTDTLSFGESAIGEKITGTKSSPNNFFDGWNGPISVSAINFADKAGKNLASPPTLPFTTNIVVDTTAPALNFKAGDEVDTGPVMSDTVTVEITETNLDSAVYTFSDDSVCNISDDFTSAPDFFGDTQLTFTDELRTGFWLCFRVTDKAENISYLSSTNPLNIDGTTPVFNEINVTSNNSKSVTTAAKIGDILTFTLNLTNNDTFVGPGADGRVTFEIGGTSHSVDLGPVSTTMANNYTGTHTVTASQNGLITITTIDFQDQANNDIDLTSFTSNQAPTNGASILVDTTDPVFITPIDDDTEANTVTSDNVQISFTETNIDAAATKYGFSNDNICDANDAYPNIFTSGTPFSLNTEANNGNFICFRVEDLAGNIAYITTANKVDIDITAPTFGSIGVVASTGDANYAKNGSTLNFTLTLGAYDSFNGPGTTTGQIEFTIGGIAKTVLFDTLFPPSYDKKSVYTADYGLQNGDEGDIKITNIIFQDRLGHDIDLTGFTAGDHTPTPTVIVDTIAPTLDTATVATSGNAGWAKSGDTITYTLNFDEDIVIETLNSATTAHNATTLNQDFDISTYGTTDQIIFEVANGDNGDVTINNADITLKDRAGNETTINAASINGKILASTLIQADTESPTITNISIASSNSDTTLAKTNDTITVSFVTADNLSPTVSLRNNSDILDESITSSSIGNVGASSMSRFTDGTETSEVVVPFLIKTEDEAGNRSSNYTAITTGVDVQFDRTDPLVSSVEIQATSADNSAYTGDMPVYYARQGDTLEFSFQTCDYVDTITTPSPTGTLFGQAVTLTNDGVGAGCTTPEGSNSNYRLWSTQLTNIDGTEGSVPFSIDVYDEAGNGVVTVTGTTDGSKVIFDKTRPELPTQVLDTIGDTTTTFKHRSNAQFTWAGATDPNTSLADQIADIWKYKLRLTNPASGGEDHRGTASNPEETTGTSFDGRTSNIPDPGQTEIPAREDNNPYEFRMIVVDKAGNHSHGDQTSLDWSHDPVYEQPYTIGIQGTVTDKNGTPLSGVSVQVVPRYGEVCDTNQNICVATTNDSGFYSRVIKKEQDYTVNYFKRGYYLYKADERIELDDLTVNISLTSITNNRTETQGSSQTVMITTDATFIDQYDIRRRTEIYVHVFSGNVTTEELTYQNQPSIKITSLSEIFGVTVNNPNAEIISLGNNEYIITNVGNVETNNGSLSTYGSNPLKKSITIPTTIGNSGNYSGGQRRSNYTVGEIWTRAEVTADNARIDNGWSGKINYYTNDNGYEIFSGYTNGRLPIKKLYRPRNIPIATNIASALQKEEQIRNNPQKGQKLMMQTTRKKSSIGDTVKKRSQFRGTTDNRDKSHVRAVSKRYQQAQTNVNKFAPTRSSEAKPSQMTRLSDSNPRYRLMKGMPTISFDQLSGQR
jgi:hypothetical protein